MEKITNFKRLLSGVLSAVIAFSAVPIVSTNAEESTELYPYTLFAASSDEGAITIKANNFCVNGNVATNGTIVSSGNMNINGTRTENANEEMIYILKKLNYSYFSGDNVDVYDEDYSFEDININIDNPMDVYGSLELTGNINLNSGIKAYEDVTINGEVKNTNEAVICSETGDIIIETTNVNFNGLIYAPYGDIIIDTDNLNLNNVVIIGQTITLDCPSVNANYSRNTAELVGTESDVDVALYAMGEYNNEANSIDIEWYTNYSNSSYEIWISDDNVNYTSVDVVSNGTTTYQYLITEDFEQRYFKVSLITNYGEYIESIPFIVKKNGGGYITDYLDSDEDGLPDVIEIQIGTDINSQDTDEDDLTDYQEVFITKTDPLVWDSVITGISDANADIDSDGLSNIQELELGTDPHNDDSDYDHLKDGDELTYGTDPLNPDSDGDTILDGDEDVLGFNPSKYDTNDDGIPDGEEYTHQTVNPDRYDADLFENNLAIPSLQEVTAKGNVNSNIRITEHNGYLKGEERSYVGKAIEISNSDISDGKLSFILSDEYDIKEYDLFGEITNGLVIYFNDGNETIPLDTVYDADSRSLSANIISQGYFFVMDVVDWINSLGIDLNEYIIEPVSTNTSMSPKMLKKAPAKTSACIADINIKGQVDIVFVIDTTGSMDSHINNVKNNLKSFVDDIEKAGIKPNFALVKYEDITHDGVDSTEVKKNGSSNWFMDADKFKGEISKLTLGNGGDWPETAIDGLEMAHQLDMRNTAQKFIVLVTDANYKVDNNYGIKSLEELSLSLKNDNISTSVVTANEYKETYKILYNTTDGIFADINGNFKNELLKISDKINEETNNGYWIALKGFIPQIVKLDEKPTLTGNADSDLDTLLDRNELKSITPTEYWNVNDFLKKLGLNINISDVRLPVYDYYSNPKSKDTDGDNILDPKDNQRRYKNNYPAEIVDYINNDIINMNSTEETTDDFVICTVSLSEILSSCGINSLTDDEGYEYSVEGYYDDWYLMALNNDDTTYGLYKMREQEYDSDDNNDPGVTISFVEFDISKFNDVIYHNSSETSELYNEIDYVVRVLDAKYSTELQSYFLDVDSEAPYSIAEAYVKKIAQSYPSSSIPFPDNLNNIYDEIESIDELIDEMMNSFFPDSQTIAALYREKEKKSRIPKALSDCNDKFGSTISDSNNRVIYVSNSSNLDYYEKKAILSAYTADISFNMFAAEVQAHADFLDDFLSKFKGAPVLNKWYRSALRADMAIGEEYESGMFDDYYNPNDSRVKKQAKAHGEY